MARIIYDNEQPPFYDSGGFNGSRFNGSYVLLIIVILLLLYFWADLPRLRDTLDHWLSGSPNATVLPAQGPNARSNLEVRYVTADNLNMREEPSERSRASYLLSRGTRVVLLGESHQDSDSDMWLRVRTQSYANAQVGWVRQSWIGRNQEMTSPSEPKRAIRRNSRTRYIAADDLDLREQPRNDAHGSHYMPRGSKVILVGNTQLDENSELWLQVSFTNFDGTHLGWVNQRYLQSP